MSLLSGGGRVAAQVVLDDRAAPAGLAHIAACGDIDHDGVPDFVVSNPTDPTGARKGWLGVLSGSDRSVIHEFHGRYVTEKFAMNEILGDSLDGAGDFDGDGTPDVVVGSPGYQGTGRVLVLSGEDGVVRFVAKATLHLQGLGGVVRGLGDVDGDGYDDIAASDQEGHVVVWRGPTGEILRIPQGFGEFAPIARLGDVDGDGAADYLIGWSDDATAGVGTGAAVIYSGATGVGLHTVYGVRAADGLFLGDHLGASVAGVGDVDLDGTPDFAVDAPGHWLQMDPTILGYFRVYSGTDAWRLTPTP